MVVDYLPMSSVKFAIPDFLFTDPSWLATTIATSAKSPSHSSTLIGKFGDIHDQWYWQTLVCSSTCREMCLQLTHAGAIYPRPYYRGPPGDAAKCHHRRCH